MARPMGKQPVVGGKKVPKCRARRQLLATQEHFSHRALFVRVVRAAKSTCFHGSPEQLQEEAEFGAVQARPGAKLPHGQP